MGIRSLSLRASDKCAWAYAVVHGASWRTVASTAGGCIHLIRLLLRGVRLGFNVLYRAEAFAVKAEYWAMKHVTSSNPFDHLDDLCLDVVMRHVPNALDLAACRASCHALRQASGSELRRRVHAHIHVASGVQTLPEQVECRGQIVDRPYDGSRLVDVAAHYAGGYAALLAGREGRLKVTAPGPLRRMGASTSVSETLAGRAPAALLLWDIVRCRRGGGDRGYGRRSSTFHREPLPAWCAVQPVLDDLFAREHPPIVRNGEVDAAVREGTLGSVFYPCGPRLRGDPHMWMHQSVLFDSNHEAVHLRSERHAISGSFSDHGPDHVWNVRASVVAPGASETLVEEFIIDPQQLLPILSIPDDDFREQMAATPRSLFVHRCGPGVLASNGMADNFAAEEMDDDPSVARVKVFEILMAGRAAAGAGGAAAYDAPLGIIGQSASLLKLYVWTEACLTDGDGTHTRWQELSRYHIDFELWHMDDLNWTHLLASAEASPQLACQECPCCHNRSRGRLFDRGNDALL